MAAIVSAISAGEARDVSDTLAAVMPGGKSLLPVIAAACQRGEWTPPVGRKDGRARGGRHMAAEG